MTLESIEKLRELAKNVRNANCDTSPSIVSQLITANADAIEREIAERYMLLPVDADGVPIRVGDQMTDKSEREDCLGIAKWDVVSVNEIAFFDMSGGVHMGAGQVHVKPDPVKELLEEFLREREHIACRLEHGELNIGDSVREDDACAELYAKKLRELLGGDGR